jgi:phosphatidylinositol glycan class B
VRERQEVQEVPRRQRLSPFQKVLLLSFVLHGMAAGFSVGFSHPDEHFQVLEWASYQMGWTPADALPWEFKSQIRSWFHPGLVTAGWKTLSFFSGDSLSHAAFVAFTRALHALFGWISCAVLAQSLGLWFSGGASKQESSDALKPEGRDATQLNAAAPPLLWLQGATLLFFFLPFLHARTSSENLSSSFLALSVAVLPRAFFSRNRALFWALLSGVLGGAAFLARFQSALFLAPLLLALLFISPKERFSAFCVWLFGVLAVIGVGVGIDAWGYGALVFTPWRYFQSNVLQGAAAGFGTMPPWGYLTLLFAKTPWPWGWLSLSTLVLCLKDRTLRRHPWVMASTAFVLLHSLIAHKELRFLFPLAPFFPALALLALWSTWVWQKRSVKVALLVLNALFLAFLSTFPNRSADSLRYVLNRRADASVNLLYGVAPDPYQDVLPIWVSRPEGYRYLVMPSERAFLTLLQGMPVGSTPVRYFHTEARLEGSAEVLRERCQREAGALPAWMPSAKQGAFRPMLTQWTLFSCRPG